MRNLSPIQAQRLLKVQVMTSVACALVGLIAGVAVAESALIGGLAATLGTAILAKVVFGAYRANESQLLAMRILMAEIARLVVVIVIFAATFLLMPSVNVAALLGVYLVVHVLPAFMASRIDAIKKT